MAFRHPNPGIRPPVQLARDLEGHDPRHVRLEREQLEIEHQPGMVVERVGHADRRIRDGHRGHPALALGALDALLDVAHRVEVLVHHHPIPHAQTALQTGHVRHREVEHAPVPLQPGRLLLGRPPFAEEPLEHRAGVALHRHRGRGVLPRVGVLIDAAVPVLAASDDVLVVERELQRAQRGVGADRRRRHLVHRGARLDVRALGLLRTNAAQPGGMHAGVHPAALALRLRPLVAQAAQHHHVVAERLERLQHRGHRVPLPGGGGVEVRQIRAVGRIDEAQPGHPALPRRDGGQRRHHRIQKREGQRRPHPAQEAPSRQRHFRNDHPDLLQIKQVNTNGSDSRCQGAAAGGASAAAVRRSRNGRLSTMPRTTADRR